MRRSHEGAKLAKKKCPENLKIRTESSFKFVELVETNSEIKPNFGICKKQIPREGPEECSRELF